MRVLGLMSGSSLDGLDLALLEILPGSWKHSLIKASTVPYPEHIVSLLTNMASLPILQYTKADHRYTRFVCDCIKAFLGTQSVDLISSHGHTIIHQPEEGVTLQCGDPVMIAALLEIDTVGNFRQLDVCRGGQGAPLAPYGQQMFSDSCIDVYLNLGGICNIDCKRIGWDIAYCNLFGNYMALQRNKPYDQGGSLGQAGSVDKQMLSLLQKDIKITEIKHQKSFGRQDFEQFIGRLESTNLPISVQDKLRTYYQFLSEAIIRNVKEIARIAHIESKVIRVLCTGGGTYNTFLLQLLNATPTIQFVPASKDIAEFKEAMIFALLGAKYVHGRKNCSTGVGGILAKGAKPSLE